jgi:hypothetical protein
LYRQGLGDAFLLAFPRAGDAAASEPFYVLIDCGVIHGTRQPRSLMLAVAEDVAAATNGRIDLLVISHEHWDHLSGFLQAEEVWKDKVHIKSVWMAWTEDMSIPLAKRLKEDFHNDLDALRLALDQAGEDTVHAEALTSLLGLFGDPLAFLAAARKGDRFSEMTHNALNKVRELAGNRVEYRMPGETLRLADVPGVRVYILGPPQDERVLRNINPSKRRPQTYTHAQRAAMTALMGTRPSEKTAFTLALKCAASPGTTLLPVTDREKEVNEQCFPFDRHLRIPLADAAAIPFFREYYGFPNAQESAAGAAPPPPAASSPLLPGPAWRRLETEGQDSHFYARKSEGGKRQDGKDKDAKDRRTKGKSGKQKTAKKAEAQFLPAPRPEPAPEAESAPEQAPEPAPPQPAAPRIDPQTLFPFDRHLRISLKSEAVRHPFFWEHYGFDDTLPSPPLPAPAPPAPPSPPVVNGPEWRRIDKDWLGVASELALQMDSYTNNTSLALAIELVATGKVLLFPADAQVGNWLSWDWIDPPFTGADGRPVTAADLLHRTVFYKVGHHGSHNATLREAGLERMVAPDLFAYVPVDERVARDVRHWKHMPFEPLLARLYEKTRGRVIRLDHGVITDTRPEFVTAEMWERLAPTAQSFRKTRVEPGGRLPVPDGVADEPLYYQVVIEDSLPAPSRSS